MIAWSTIQSAVAAWVKAQASGYNVIWARQNGQKPARPLITLAFGDLVSLGATDERRRAYNPAGSGTLTTTVVGQRALPLSIQASTTGTTGSTAARSVLSQVQASLALPSVRAALRAVGLSPYDRGLVREVSTVLDADFEGRALLVVGFYVAETISEVTPFIERVTGSGTLDNPGGIDIARTFDTDDVVV